MSYGYESNESHATNNVCDFDGPAAFDSSDDAASLDSDSREIGQVKWELTDCTGMVIELEIVRRYTV